MQPLCGGRECSESSAASSYASAGQVQDNYDRLHEEVMALRYIQEADPDFWGDVEVDLAGLADTRTVLVRITGCRAELGVTLTKKYPQKPAGISLSYPGPSNRACKYIRDDLLHLARAKAAADTELLYDLMKRFKELVFQDQDPGSPVVATAKTARQASSSLRGGSSGKPQTKALRWNSESGGTSRQGASSRQIQSRIKTNHLKRLIAEDDQLRDAIRAGHIKLLSVAWLLTNDQRRGLPRILPRQQMEELDHDAFLAPDVAVEALSRGDRSIFALSHGWLAAGDPDPHGIRVDMVVRFFRRMQDTSGRPLPVDAGLFWDFCSLHQHMEVGQPQRPRTLEERGCFQKGLRVMADLYASPIGVTVLQIRQTPACPKELAGLIRISGHWRGVDVRKDVLGKMRAFSTMRSIEQMDDDIFGNPVIEVRFQRHDAAKQACDTLCEALRRGDATVRQLQPPARVKATLHPLLKWGKLRVHLELTPKTAQGVFVRMAYNERPYDERGWCIFEDAVAREALRLENSMVNTSPSNKRSVAYLQVPDLFLKLPSKIYLLSTTGADTVTVSHVSDKQRNKAIKERIEAAHFTAGKQDKDAVHVLYSDYVNKISRLRAQNAKKP
jgi:hypothetical protein